MQHRSQSAMEYLTTYGWLIMIIAVVLVVLFELGVFNASNFEPKAQPGACYVYRPDGPGTTKFINFAGECSGRLPKFVAQLNGNGGNVTILTNRVLATGNTITMTAWVKWNSGKHLTGGCCGSRQEVFGTDSSPTAEINPIIAINDSGTGEAETWVCTTGGCWNEAKSASGYIVPNVWYFMASRYNGTAVSIWIDGSMVAETTDSGTLNLQGSGLYTYIGSRGGAGSFFNGSVANAQMYNTALSSNAIAGLYGEGIGGTPIDLQNLLGWWPLNGNAKDYGGNGYNGKTSAGLTFTSSWTDGYTVP